MEGMTGTKTRHFYNNLLNIEDAICNIFDTLLWEDKYVVE
jgi:hypothetical protein